MRSARGPLRERGCLRKSPPTTGERVAPGDGRGSPEAALPSARAFEGTPEKLAFHPACKPGLARPRMPQALLKSWRLNGRTRTRFPVRAKTAFATAGPIGGTPGSPTPEGSSVDGTMWTSTSGISSSRRTS